MKTHIKHGIQRITALVLILLMLVSMTACGDDSGKTDDNISNMGTTDTSSGSASGNSGSVTKPDGTLRGNIPGRRCWT